MLVKVTTKLSLTFFNFHQTSRGLAICTAALFPQFRGSYCFNRKREHLGVFLNATCFSFWIAQWSLGGWRLEPSCVRTGAAVQPPGGQCTHHGHWRSDCEKLITEVDKRPIHRNYWNWPFSSLWLTSILPHFAPDLSTNIVNSTNCLHRIQFPVKKETLTLAFTSTVRWNKQQQSADAVALPQRQ
jgi:hypothetical protein